MLKKKTLFAMFIVSVVLLLGGCFTAPKPGNIVFDPYLPPERTAVVIFNGTIRVQEYNGINISEDWYPDDKARENTVTLPAGQTTLLLNINSYFEIGRTIYRVRAEDVQLSYNFEPGETYFLGIYAETEDNYLVRITIGGRYTWGLGIWSGSKQGYRDDAIKYWDLGQF
jgi:hypothetical protein